jgi:LmbE family N-acetylglucosaminyl deacetylase
MNVLVIAPHPDDEAIGCGGAIGIHVARGDRVSVVFLTSGELGLKHLSVEKAWQQRESEAQASAEILGITNLTFLRQSDWFISDNVEETAAALRPVLYREWPGLIYLPHPGEWHPDHKASLSVVRAALRGEDRAPPTLRCYEFWTPLPQYDHVEDITETMARKLRAVRCYRSQLAEYRYDQAVRGLNQYRGITTARCRFAEVFKDFDAQPTVISTTTTEAGRDAPGYHENG